MDGFLDGNGFLHKAGMSAATSLSGGLLRPVLSPHTPLNPSHSFLVDQEL